jgi:hypothetical protein
MGINQIIHVIKSLFSAPTVVICITGKQPVTNYLATLLVIQKVKKKAPHQRQGYDKHNSHSASGNPSTNQVDFNPTFQELQVSLPNLTEDQYVQILSALTTKPITP